MSKIFLGVIVVLLSITGFLYYQNQRLASLNQAFDLRDQEQRATIDSLQNDFLKRPKVHYSYHHILKPIFQFLVNLFPLYISLLPLVFFIHLSI